MSTTRRAFAEVVSRHAHISPRLRRDGSAGAPRYYPRCLFSAVSMEAALMEFVQCSGMAVARCVRAQVRGVIGAVSDFSIEGLRQACESLG
eukprot:12800285-Alexandrium_andersonii.AAC.1